MSKSKEFFYIKRAKFPSHVGCHKCNAAGHGVCVCDFNWIFSLSASNLMMSGHDSSYNACAVVETSSSVDSPETNQETTSLSKFDSKDSLRGKGK